MLFKYLFGCARKIDEDPLTFPSHKECSSTFLRWRGVVTFTEKEKHELSSSLVKWRKKNARNVVSQKAGNQEI